MRLVSKIEMLVALVVLAVGLLVIAATFPGGIKSANIVKERLLARIIAQNYSVAIQSKAASNGFEFFADKYKLDMEHLEGAPEGGNVVIRDISSLKDGFDVSPDFEQGGLFYPEVENSNGTMLVRILFNKSKDDNGSEICMFKISVKSLQSGKIYDFWTAVTPASDKKILYLPKKQQTE